jgi:hypothetical protein
MDTKLAAARWSLGYLSSKDLPQIALAWLEAGIDSPTTRALAGDSQPIMSEVGPLFEHVFAEHNIPIPAPAVAALQLSQHIAHEVVVGIKAPHVGASEIAVISRDNQEANLPLAFAGLASEYEDFDDAQHAKYYGAARCEEVRQEIEAQIVEEARKLLEVKMTN